MARKRKRKPLSRFVYIMRVRLPTWDFRWVAYRLQGRKLYKIGVATDAEARQKTVDRSHPANVSLQDKYYCQAATKHESHLHQEFEEQAFLILGMDGGTEVFKLRPNQLRYARRYLRRESDRYHNRDRPMATAVFLLIVTTIYLLIKAFG